VLQKLNAHHVWQGACRCYAFESGAVRPGVTSVLSAGPEPEWLTRWREEKGEEEAERIRNAAANRGTALHHRIESFFGAARDEPPTFDTLAPDPALIDRMFEKALPVLHRLDPLMIEGPIQWSSDDPVIGNGFAGTVDMLARVKPRQGGPGTLAVIDWKSSTRTVRRFDQGRDKTHKYLLQLSAYRAALRQCYPQELQELRHAMAVVIPETGSRQIFEFDERQLLAAELEFVQLLRRFYTTNDNGPTTQLGRK